MWWVNRDYEERPKIIVTIDQSLSNTAVCVYDVDKNEVLDISYFQIDKTPTMRSERTPIDLSENLVIIWERQITNLCDKIIKHLIEIISKYVFFHEIAIGIEKPGQGKNSNYEVLYRLGYFYMKLTCKLNMVFNTPIINIHSATWKSVFFGDKNTTKMEKSLLHEYFFTDRINLHDIELSEEIDKELNNDGRDSVGLLVFMLFYLGIKYGHDKINKSLYKHYCDSVQGSNLCWHCKYLEDCPTMSKKIPTPRAKKNFPLYWEARKHIINCF